MLESWRPQYWIKKIISGRINVLSKDTSGWRGKKLDAGSTNRKAVKNKISEVIMRAEQQKIHLATCYSRDVQESR